MGEESHLMHQGEINPSLENNAIKRNLGQTQKRVLFSSTNVPGDTRRGRGPYTVPLPPAEEVGIVRMQRGSVQCHRQTLEEISPWAGSWAARSPEEHPQHCKNNSTFNSGQYKDHLEKSVFLEKFQQSAVEITPPHGGFAHVESLLHGEVTFLGHAFLGHVFLGSSRDPCRKTPAGKLSESLSWAQDNEVGLGMAVIFTALNLIDYQDLFCLFF